MKFPDNRYRHGGCGTKLHNSWRKIKERCYSKKSISYKHYGAIGIGLYEPWIKDFSKFREYVESLPNANEDGYSIDRVLNSINYEPMNLRWSTKSTQAQNTRKLRSTNTSGYRGVSAYNNGSYFKARISVNNVPIYLGSFKTKIDAAIAFDDYVINNKLHHIKNFTTKERNELRRIHAEKINSNI